MIKGCPRCNGPITSWYGEDCICLYCGNVIYSTPLEEPLPEFIEGKRGRGKPKGYKSLSSQGVRL